MEVYIIRNDSKHMGKKKNIPYYRLDINHLLEFEDGRESRKINIIPKNNT